MYPPEGSDTSLSSNSVPKHIINTSGSPALIFLIMTYWDLLGPERAQGEAQKFP